MTKLFASFLNAIIGIVIAILPRWKRLTVRARLFDKLQTFETVQIGDKTLQLFIPDRTCVYWAKSGPNSEPTTNAWIKSFAPEDTFLDIGANIGLYSMMAAAHGVTRVYAIEPNPFSFSVLARNIVANKLDTVISPLCLAMSEGSSVVTFKLGSLHAGSIYNEIMTDESTAGGMSITTTSFSVDELFKIQGMSEVNHLKIDVDGLELQILRGATKTLSDKALKTVLVEDNSEDKNSASKLISFLGRFDFVQSDAWGKDGTDNKIFIRD
ncbi:MAG: FkbM family methyltransferase [Rhodospirillales bacterium]|nr:FkbM family methyltransferase [Rhodospirillales bacterium]